MGADIVASNLKTIERVCSLEGLSGAEFLYMEDSSETDFGGPYDHIFVRGSLMTMPFALQQKAMANFKKALKPGGQIILNLYQYLRHLGRGLHLVNTPQFGHVGNDLVDTNGLWHFR